MQLFALDSDGQWVNARQARKQQNYFCLECSQIIRLREGPHRRAHFYHLDPTPFCRQHQKGIIHLQIQAYFQTLLPQGDCRLEHRFPEINRIADAAWLSQKILFEIQYSAISAEEVLSRNLDYRSCGWTVVWILHDQRFNKTRLSAAEIALRTSPHYFTNIDQMGRGLIYDQFDRCEGGLRKERQPPLPIDPTAFLMLPSQLSEEWPLSLLKERAQHWQVSFEGDLLNSFLKNPLSDYFKKALSGERRAVLHQASIFQRVINFFWYKCLARPYRIFFRALLERSCR